MDKLFKLAPLLIFFAIVSFFSGCSHLQCGNLYSTDNPSHKSYRLKVYKGNNQRYLEQKKSCCINRLLSVSFMKKDGFYGKIQPDISEFGYKLLQEVNEKLMTNIGRCESCGVVCDAMHLVSDEGESIEGLDVKLSYEISEVSQEMDINLYAKTIRVDYKIFYKIFHNKKVISEGEVSTSRSIMNPESGYAYLIGLESREESAAIFLAEMLLDSIRNRLIYVLK